MTYIEFIKSLGYDLIIKFDSYDRAFNYRYDMEQKHTSLKVILLENIYVWNEKYEIWAKPASRAFMEMEDQ
jgi:hypothetical protein